MAIPRLAERVGVSARVLRYWEEQGIISPSREHGRLRYGPRDEAIARLARRLMEASGCGVETVRTLRRTAEREVAGGADEVSAIETALRLLYARKAFADRYGSDPERLGAAQAGPPPRAGPPPKEGKHPDGRRKRHREDMREGRREPGPAGSGP